MKKIFVSFLASAVVYASISCNNADAKISPTHTAAYSQYIILVRDDTKQLEKLVNHYLSKLGYSLVGGVCYGNGNFYQAIAR